ncbi:MAG TPA: S53 family peptidase [Gemmataceae bacterium]|nr:S53 family peptidase [Gemmataceae bacterium]
MLGFVRTTHPVTQKHGRLRCEELEPRTLLTIYAPSQILHAYGFDKLPYDGTGQTIAVVDAYDNPNAASDLTAFDQQFNLPDPAFTIAQPEGQPSADLLWGLEINLDVQWAHAIAPGASILLVEAKTSSLGDMMTAVDYARQQPGVVAVTMSWGSSEFSLETRDDSYFTTPSGHIGGSGLPGGVTFVAASGDSGGSVIWPSSSTNVLSIGGTALTLDDSNNIASETGWSGSGGGPSKFESEPNAQQPFQGYAMRTTPDFSYNADLYSAYYVVDSYGFNGLVGVYGTSAGSEQWAALIALADQALALQKIGSLDGATQTIPALYNLANTSYATYYNDIVDGYNGYQAGPGYDLVTGLGSPIADQVVQGLINGIAPPPGSRAAASKEELLTQSQPAERTRTAESPIQIVHLSTPLLSPSRGVEVVAIANPVAGDVPKAAEVSTAANWDGKVAVPLIQPTQVASARPAENRLESGGGESGIFADDLGNDGLDGIERGEMRI